MICDWCGKNSSEALQRKKGFRILEDYVNTPVICYDCYVKLKKQYRQLNKKTPSIKLLASISSGK